MSRTPNAKNNITPDAAIAPGKIAGSGIARDRCDPCPVPDSAQESAACGASQIEAEVAAAAAYLPESKNAGCEPAEDADKKPRKRSGKACKISSIGGQAVIEGVMMRGVTATALAVRSEEGELLLDTSRNKKRKTKIHKVPILRGIVNFVAMLIVGMKMLIKSADVFGTDDEEMPKGFIGFSVFLGIALAVVLFIFLPSLIMDGFIALGCPDTPIVSALIEGLVRLLLFIGYLLLTTLLKDIRRTYMYHGAEHKTINCYEHEKELTVENVRASSKVHKRCGTTFLFIVLVVTIIMFALANWLTIDVFGWKNAWWIKLLVRLVLLPLVAGISYEVLKLLAWLPDNWFTKALRAPGLSLQMLTTREPDDSMIEVAIASFNAVMEMDADPDKKTESFETVETAHARDRVSAILKETDAEDAETDWILCSVLECKRGEISSHTEMKRVLYNRAVSYAKKRAAGQPLYYVIGTAPFYGEEIVVTPSVLIPRPETELVAEQAVLIVKSKTGERRNNSAENNAPVCETKENGAPEPDAPGISVSESGAETAGTAETRACANELNPTGTGIAEADTDVRNPAETDEKTTNGSVPCAAEKSPESDRPAETPELRRTIKVLDLCTGSGCIALALAKNTSAQVTAADISPEALNVARRNLAGTSAVVVESDLFSAIEERFDVIVSNPPYIPTGELAGLQKEVKKEPVLALNGGDDGLDVYRAICRQAGGRLKANGALVLELGIGQATAVQKMLEGWSCEIKKDYAGIDRILIAKKG